MPKLRNISGHTLEIPDAGGLVEDDGVFTVPDELLESFTCQPSNYAVVEEAKPRTTKEK